MLITTIDGNQIFRKVCGGLIQFNYLTVKLLPFRVIINKFNFYYFKAIHFIIFLYNQTPHLSHNLSNVRSPIPHLSFQLPLLIYKIGLLSKSQFHYCQHYILIFQNHCEPFSQNIHHKLLL